MDELRGLHLNGNSVMNVFETSYSELWLIEYIFLIITHFFVKTFCGLRFFLYFCTVPMLEVIPHQKLKAPLQVIFRRDAIFGKGVYHTLVL